MRQRFFSSGSIRLTGQPRRRFIWRGPSLSKDFVLNNADSFEKAVKTHCHFTHCKAACTYKHTLRTLIGTGYTARSSVSPALPWDFALHSRRKTVKCNGIFLMYFHDIGRCLPMISVIINPVAGAGLAKSIGQKVTGMLAARGMPHHVAYTEYAGHATQLARKAASEGAATVVSVGGDGTLNEIAAGLAGTQTALGIIPAGTGNDFIKIIGTPKKWDDAVAYILNNPAHPLDTGMVNDRFFINVCGAGFDVMVLEYANKAKKHVRGIWPYLYGVFAAIRAFKPFEMQVEIGDDIRLAGKFMICTIANGSTIGGGIPIMPIAKVDDGLLDIMVVDPVPAWQIVFYLPSILGGTLLKKRIAHHFRATHCKLNCHNMILNMDGELIPAESASFTCKPASLLAHWPGTIPAQC